MSIWGQDCCCNKSCDMSDCDISITEWADGSAIDTDEIICSDGTPASVTISNTQDTDIGNPSPSRKISIEQSGTATDDTRAYAFVFDQTMPLTVLDIADIVNATWCVEAKKSSSNVTEVTVVPAVRQGSNLYVSHVSIDAKNISTGFRPKNWTAIATVFDKLEAGSFNPNSSLHPSTADGSPDIEFGIAVRFLIEADDTGKSADVHLDNCCIKYNGTFDCYCLRSTEFQVDVSGITNIGTAWFESSGSYVLSYNSDAIPNFCWWILIIPASPVNWTVDVFISKIDGSVQVNFNRGSRMAQFKTSVGVVVDCGGPVTAYNQGVGLYPGNFPASVTVTPL